jgi:hypothetical protein
VLNADTVTNNNIVTGSITGGKLAASTITAAQIAAGTITATQISASYVYAGNIISTNAANSFPSVNSPGYWLRYDTGDARFGGNVSIGNNLTVGNLITTSQLNANVVSYNNLVSGTINPPVGASVYLPSSISLTSASNYDVLYTSGSYYGYYKTLAYITIPVTASMAQLTSTSQLVYVSNFSCNVVASGILAGSNGPLFFGFTNQQQTITTYGGSNIKQAIPYFAGPPSAIPPGGSNNPGSLLGPQFGRILTGTGTSPTSYTGPLSFSTTTRSPYTSGSAAGTLVQGSTIVIGICMFNGTSAADIGSVNLTNMSFVVNLQ